MQAKLEALRGQITSLEYEKKQALLSYLRGRATVTLQQYQRPWDELCRAYDQIVGVRRALEYGRPLEPIQLQRLDDPQRDTTRHTGDGELARRTRAKWEEARARLDTDPDASIDDLIGVEPESDSAHHDSQRANWETLTNASLKRPTASMPRSSRV